MSKHRFGALAAAGILVLSFAGTALAVTYATVDGYANGDAANNQAGTWGDNCEKVFDGESTIDSWEADADYAKVIVKAGSDASTDYANTIFNDVAKGEVVWADTNGDGIYNPGGKDGDKNISHIIVCLPVTTTTTTTTNETTTSSESTTTTTTTATTTSNVTTEPETTTSSTTTKTTSKGTEAEKTPPQTDTIGQSSTSTVSGGLFLVFAGLLALALVVPAKARSRR